MGTPVYGLLGRSLKHSWSVAIHRALGCPDYRLIELEPEALPAFLRREDVGGFNVTLPYKRAVLPLCGWIDPAAAAIGSANTLVRREDGILCAYNTDAMGFCRLVERAGLSFVGRKTVILGSGGAALAVRAAAEALGARELVLISRSGPDDYAHLARHRDAELVVNATPVGMYPGNGSAPVDLRDFPACRGVVDLIYNPRRTALLLQAEALGLPCWDGLPMLVYQAAAAEALFFGRAVPDAAAEALIARLRRDTGNLVLIGLPGCGKSTVGRLLSQMTGREAVDIDRVIEARAGRSIPELFASEGESAFRALEREAVFEAGKSTGKILVPGGGVVLDEANYAPLRQNGRIYHLLRAPELLPTRGRPLSEARGPAALWAERKLLYERFRDAEIDNNGTAEDAAAAIWREYCANSGTERAESEPAGSPSAGDLRPGNL